MSDNRIRTLRLCAATLITLAGIGLIAALWHRELTPPALLDAVVGTSYIVVGLGLYGRSRFSLFVGAALCVTSVATLGNTVESPDTIIRLRMGTEAIVAILCTFVFWRVRNDKSV